MTSGTPLARYARTVGWSYGPLGRTLTSRGTSRLTACQSSAVGRRSPAVKAMAGMCSSRFVEPPKAAWTHMALRIAASVRIWRGVIPRGEDDERPGRAAGHVAPDRLARGHECRMRQGHPQGLDHNLRSGCRAQELAAAPRAGTLPAAQLRGFFQAQLTMSVAGAKRLDLAGVFAIARRQSHAAGHEHACQIV